MFRVESEALGIDDARPSQVRMYAQMNWLFHKCLYYKWWKVVTMINMQMVELMKVMWNHGDKWVVIKDMVWEMGVYKCTPISNGKRWWVNSKMFCTMKRTCHLNPNLLVNVNTWTMKGKTSSKFLVQDHCMKL
jgi:hypothetical protein